MALLYFEWCIWQPPTGVKAMPRGCLGFIKIEAKVYAFVLLGELLYNFLISSSSLTRLSISRIDIYSSMNANLSELDSPLFVSTFRRSFSIAIL